MMVRALTDAQLPVLVVVIVHHCGCQVSSQGSSSVCSLQHPQLSSNRQTAAGHAQVVCGSDLKVAAVFGSHSI